MAMIDPRTPEGRLTLRYRGLPTSILLAMLGVYKEATNDRPFYSRNELIEQLVIRNMAEELNALKTELVGEEVYKDAKGESRTMYRLDRKHTFILVAGYSVHLRAKCYDHIQTLERRVLQLEDQQKQEHLLKQAQSGKLEGL